MDINDVHRRQLLAQPHLLVIDLEATCFLPPGTEGEIIEIGCALLDVDHGVADTCSLLVQPARTPINADCTRLTSITPAMVEFAPRFPAAMLALADIVERWQPKAWASWGGYDRRALTRQCEQEGVPNALADLEHFDAKELLSPLLKQWFDPQAGERRKRHRYGLGNAAQLAGLSFEGTHHRGVDDARMAARVVHAVRGRAAEDDFWAPPAERAMARNRG